MYNPEHNAVWSGSAFLIFVSTILLEDFAIYNSTNGPGVVGGGGGVGKLFGSGAKSCV